LIRGILSSLWTIIVVPIPLVGSLFVIGRPARKARLGARAHQIWAKGLLWIYDIRITVHGNLPPTGSFVVSNHVSWLDILVLASLYPSNFVGKSQLAAWPVMGFLCRCGGTIFINREKRSDAPRVVEELRLFLNGGATISLFPEGWCGDGKIMRPFKRSLFAAPAASSAPCIPAFLCYNRPEVVWVDESNVIRHAIRLFRGGPVQVDAYFGLPEKNTDRRSLALACEQAVGEMFRPI